MTEDETALVHRLKLRLNSDVTKQRLPVSVCMIAANEAQRIRRALESVAGWTSEIIVVLNDDVADGTDKIAESFGAKIFREPWKGHVAQKNSAAQKAAQEWILGLDADEVVTPELRAEIQSLFAEPQKLKNFAAFSFPRCTFYCGRWIRHGDWYPDRKIRLWRRGQAHWGGIDPHDTVIVDGKVGGLKSDLQHYSMENLNHHVRKIMSYSDMFAQQRAEHGRKISAFTLWFRPWFRFMRGYFLRFGFLDGWQGYTIARMTAFENFLRYTKLREAQLAQSKFDQPA
ncbi:MAG TPA: glycosyltransferase family 2 protein [Verrucomicrobiae bacterium]|nr:glycosyltransferase family 2 protein [Verrucomicrobiae bacterium]